MTEIIVPEVDDLLEIELNLTRRPTDMQRRAILRGCVGSQLEALRLRFGHTSFSDDAHVVKLIVEEEKRRQKEEAELERRVSASEGV